MGFNIEFRDKDGATVDWPQLDKEVCELWEVEPDTEHWAKHPGKASTLTGMSSLAGQG